MTHHDHSKVEVDELGLVTAMIDRKGNACPSLMGPTVGLYECRDRCPAYGRYIDRRVSHPAEDPRASARWANDWPATTGTGAITTDGPCRLGSKAGWEATIGCLYVYDKDGKSHAAGTPEASRAFESLFAQRGGTTRSVAREIESAQDEYPPVYDRPTFFLCVLIAALAGMLVGIIAGAMVMT